MRNEKSTFATSKELDSEVFEVVDDEPTCYTDRSKVMYQGVSTFGDTGYSEKEKQLKLDSLNSIFWIDTIDLLNFDDILDADFIQGLLWYMKPDEFHFDRDNSPKNPFVHILYQMKNFLHLRNFNAVRYLRDLKAQFDNNIYTEDANWAILRLTVLISFLLKDTSEYVTKLGPLSIITQGLDFQDKSTVKPSFIKGLILTLNNVLINLDHFDDESIVDIAMGIQSESFVQADPKMVEIRKSIACEQLMKTMGTTQDYSIVDELSPRFSPAENIYDFERLSTRSEKDDNVIGEIEGRFNLRLLINSYHLEINENDSDSDEDLNNIFARENSKEDAFQEPRVTVNKSLRNTLSFSLRANSNSMVNTNYLSPSSKFSKTFLRKMSSEYSSKEKVYQVRIRRFLPLW